MNPMNLAAGLQILAAQEPEGPEFGKASPLGLLIIIVLLVATAFLIRSMNKRLKKLPKNFDTDHPQADQEFDDGTDTVDPEDDATAEATDEVQADERKSAGT